MHPPARGPRLQLFQKRGAWNTVLQRRVQENRGRGMPRQIGTTHPGSCHPGWVVVRRFPDPGVLLSFVSDWTKSGLGGMQPAPAWFEADIAAGPRSVRSWAEAVPAAAAPNDTIR